MRVLPPGGHPHERDRHGKRPGVGHRARREERGGSVHGQGRVPDQRDGDQQGPDGEGGDRQGARARRGRGHNNLLHEIWQCDGEQRICDSAVGGADDGRKAHHDHRPEHDEVHDDARRRRGPGGVCLHARSQRRPVRAEGPCSHSGYAGDGAEGDLFAD